MKALLASLLVLGVLATPGTASEAPGAHMISSAQTRWAFAQDDAGRHRFVSAAYVEWREGGEVTDSFAVISTGTCRNRRATSCVTEKQVVRDGSKVEFFADPLLQTATLVVGKHRVEWLAGPEVPFPSGVEYRCDGQDWWGPNTYRTATAEGVVFGRALTAGMTDEAGLSRSVAVTPCD